MNTAVAHDEQMALARRGYQVGQEGREQHQHLSLKEPSRYHQH